MRRFRFRQTVETAEITAVGDAHPQVAKNAPMRISEQMTADHLGAGALVGAFVAGGTTRTLPSEAISTLRSSLYETTS